MSYDATIYVSKDGNDSNDGLSVVNAKLTLAGAKAVTVTGENLIYIGIGTYDETCDFDTAGKYVELVGDYDGAIFSSSAGEVKHLSPTDIKHKYVRSIDRMTLQRYSSYGSLLYYHALYQDLTLNYVVLECGTTYSTIFLQPQNTSNKITFNYCSVKDTGGSYHLLWPISHYWKSISLEFNNCDFSTDGYLKDWYRLLSSIYDCVFNTCTIYEVDNKFIVANVGGRAIFNTCTFKSNRLINYADNSYGMGSSCRYIFNTCTFKNTSGTNYTNLVDIVGYDSNTTVNMDAKMGTLQETLRFNCYIDSKVLINGFNADGKTYIAYPGLGFVLSLNGTYDSKDVLHYDIINYSNVRCPIPFKFTNLEPSTTYDVTFNYKKKVNSSSSDYDVRVGILEGQQNADDDLDTTPANAYDYDDYTSSTHTYDTWYSKTLSFTTAADTNKEKEYFMLIVAATDNDVIIELTQPVITEQ